MAGCILQSICKQTAGHTWMYTKGRAWMQASLDKPFRERVLAAGQGVHAQVGPGQSVVVRWASSHNNTFSLAVVAATDEEWFHHPEYYKMLDDYIDSAPDGADESIQKPRYHGAAGNSGYGPSATSFTACAGGYCVKDLFSRELPSTDENYIDHSYDMGNPGKTKWAGRMWQYNPAIVHDEVSKTWELQPDRRVAYVSEKYPWLVSAYRFHNKVNMHMDWDLVSLDFPARTFTNEQIAAKGQHYIIHFSSRSSTDHTYTDAIDVNILKTPVDPPELIYGSSSGTWGWSKTDHCQFIEPAAVISPIHDATTDADSCQKEMEKSEMNNMKSVKFGINVVPSTNPDVVPDRISRDVEEVNPICTAGCTATAEDSSVATAGYCRLATADPNKAVCVAPARIHHLAWANPAVSGIQYETTSVAGAKPGDHIAFEWDDVVHDVWLVPAEAPDACDTTGTE